MLFFSVKNFHCFDGQKILIQKNLPCAYLVLLFCFLISLKIYSQPVELSDTVNRHYVKSYLVTHSFIAGISYMGLYSAWYSNYNTGKFSFFQDYNEWKGIDKLGHAYSCFQTTATLFSQYKSTGLNPKKAAWLSAGIVNTYFLGIEIMDGFSDGWGFSFADASSNIVGSSLALWQLVYLPAMYINFKFSYAYTPYAQYRPQLLGDNFATKILKDYNGQAYWLTFSPFVFIHSEKLKLQWIEIAIGYGADGMIAGSLTKQQETGWGTIPRFSQYLLSLDINWTQIPVKNYRVKKWLRYLNMFKLPLPYAELNRYGLFFRWWIKH